MKTQLLIVAALLTGACSDPVDPCVAAGPAQGRPAFDLIGSLRAAGAEVVDLGERLDLKAFIDAPTRVLSVNGHEVLFYEYCTGGLMAHDLGHFGIGVYASDPPDIPATEPDFHLFAFHTVIVEYVGRDPDLLALLTHVLGAELSLP